MKLDLISNRADYQDGLNPNDEHYTPIYAIEPIIKYLKPGAKILCPFDNHESNFNIVLREKGFDVTNTHIEMGYDFFNIKVDKARKFDYIISNPPYSLKFEVLSKLFEIGVPFGMLLGSLIGGKISRAKGSLNNSFAQPQQIFALSLIVLSAKLSKADGKVSKEELIAVKDK